MPTPHSGRRFPSSAREPRDDEGQRAGRPNGAPDRRANPHHTEAAVGQRLEAHDEQVASAALQKPDEMLRHSGFQFWANSRVSTRQQRVLTTAISAMSDISCQHLYAIMLGAGCPWISAGR
jgi:hypothetical protein